MSEAGLEDRSREWWSPAEHKAGIGGRWSSARAAWCQVRRLA